MAKKEDKQNSLDLIILMVAVILALIIGFFAYQNTKNKRLEVEIQQNIELENEVKENVEAINEDVENGDLTFSGIYKGVLPCADCEGIETSIAFLTNAQTGTDGDYMITENYIGATDANPYIMSGQWWIQNGNEDEILVLVDGNEQTLLKRIDENTLEMLDGQGNEITTNQKSSLRLTKDQ